MGGLRVNRLTQQWDYCVIPRIIEIEHSYQNSSKKHEVGLSFTFLQIFIQWSLLLLIGKYYI